MTYPPRTEITRQRYLARFACAAAALVLAAAQGTAAEPDGHEGHDHAGHAHGNAAAAAPAAAPAPAGDACCPAPIAPTAPAGAHAGHGHGEGGDLALTLDQIEKAQCEHRMPTYRCAECRYEVGVVQVPASLTGPGGIVATATATKRAIPRTLSLSGEIRLNENTTAHVAARLAGVIRETPADLGARVRAGDPLVRLASVDLGAAAGEYARARAGLDLARKRRDIERELHEQKVSSRQEMLDADLAFEEAQIALRAAEQRLKVLGVGEADLQSAGRPDGALFEGVLTLRAAMDGEVIAKHAAAGEYVQADHELALLADTRTVWSWLSVPAGDLARLLAARTQGPLPVEVRVTAFADQVFTGALDHVSALMDEATRTVQARAVVSNPGGLLRPGMFCEAVVALAPGAEPPVVAVPREAVMSDEGVTFVYKRFHDDCYVRRAVTAGRSAGGWVEIADGLAEGEPYVVRGAFLLKSDTLRSKMGAGCAD
jgi:cobalt-zinc-cadmium efflux system membrane fusion protein